MGYFDSETNIMLVSSALVSWGKIGIEENTSVWKTRRDHPYITSRSRGSRTVLSNSLSCKKFEHNVAFGYISVESKGSCKGAISNKKPEETNPRQIGDNGE